MVTSPAASTRPGGTRLLIRSPYLWGVLYFAGLTLLVTWPLATRLGDAVIGGIGDNLYFAWLIGWVQKALFSLHVSPLFTHLLNYPEGWSLASNEMSPLWVLLGVAFSLAGNPILGFNVVVLLTFVLSGMAVFLWVRWATNNNWAATIAGTIFAFTPFRQSHLLAGHLNILAMAPLALFFMALDRGLRPGPGTRRWGFAAGVCLGLIGLSSQYYLYMSLVLSVVWVLLHALVVRPRHERLRVYASRLAPVVVGAVPLILLSIAPYLSGFTNGVVPVRDLHSAVAYSASPTDYLLPFTGHPIWGDWIGAHFNRDYWIEASLYLGVVASVLALLGLLVSRRTAPGPGWALHLSLMSTAALLLSLGVTLHWLSRPVELHLPDALRWLNDADGTSLLLPGSLLYKFLPFYSSLRVPMRFAAFVQLFVSVLAGSGAAWLMSRVRRGVVPVLALAILLLAAIDYLPPRFELTRVGPRPVDLWLREQPSSGAVAQFPFLLAGDQASIYATLIHEKPYLGGLYTSFATPQYVRIQPILDRFPDAASVALLRDLGVRYAVIDTEWYDRQDSLDDLELALQRLGLTRAAAIDGQWVYVLK